MSRRGSIYGDGADDNPRKDGLAKGNVGEDTNMVVTPSGGTGPRLPIKGGRKLFVVTDKMKEVARRKLKELQEAELQKHCLSSTSLATTAANHVSPKANPASFLFTTQSGNTMLDKSLVVANTLMRSNEVKKTINPYKERRCHAGNFKTVPVRVSPNEKTIRTTDEVSSHCRKTPVSAQLCSNDNAHRMSSSMAGFSTAGGKQILISDDAIEAAKAKLFTEDDLEKVHDLGGAMPGFSTATGKKIQVSNKALEAAKAKLFIDDLDEAPKPEKPMAGFSTAGGKKIEVSAQAFEAAKAKLFIDDSDEAPKPEKPMAGFSTARGKKIEVSAQALEAAKAKLFIDDSDEVPKPEKPMAGFSTAGGKKIEVSTHALEAAKAKLITDEFDEAPEPKKKMAGFSTAGGTKISISDKALAAAKAKLSTDDDLENVADLGGIMAGFSTAGGKKIQVSNEALEAAKMKLSTDDLDLTQVTETMPIAMPAFSTAGGTKISISDLAVQAAKSKMFDDEDEVINLSYAVLPGFSTASGRNIVVSDEALEAAKLKILEESGVGVAPSSTGKKVGISNEAVLNEDQNDLIFDQQNEILVVNEERDSNPKEEIECNIGADVSSEIDEITRLLLQDIENSDDQFEWTSSEDTDKKLRFPLASVKSGGDLISSLKVVVVRVYPLMFCGLGKDGKRCFMSEKAFAKLEMDRVAKQEELREKLMPSLEAEVRKRFVKKEKVNPKGYTMQALQKMSGEELLNVLSNLEEDIPSVNIIMGKLNIDSKKQLEKARSEQMERIQLAIAEEIGKSMKTHLLTAEKAPSPVLKVRVMDIASFNNNDTSVTGVISIWNPQEEVVQNISECKVYEMQALKPATFHTEKEIRLGTTKTTRISPMDNNLPEKIFRRKLSVIGDVLADDFRPVYDEFDTVGVVMKVEEFKESLGQIVHFVEENGIILKVKFWSAITDWGLQDVLKSGNIVACMNLQWRMTSTENKCAFTQETSVFLTNPKVEHLMSAYQRLSCSMEKIHDFMLIQNQLLKASTTPSMEENGLQVPTRNLAKRRYLERFEEPPKLPTLPIASPCKRRKMSGKFITPRRITPKT